MLLSLPVIAILVLRHHTGEVQDVLRERSCADPETADSSTDSEIEGDEADPGTEDSNADIDNRRDHC